MENESNAGGRFVRSRLPWLVGVVALVGYLATLAHWISFANIAQVAKISGYSWQSEVFSPLYFALSAPLRWLPERWVPLGVNVFSAVCAALTLALLARAVALLPHDRTTAQRERETSDGALLSVPLAWLPPLLAVLVCGLQLTFWEHSTNGTPSMVNLLGFAYVVRALLEYRRDEREAWLYKAALAYGAIMTSEWFMVTTFPLFLTAIIWLRGLRFFNLGFLGRMALFGLLGLSLYLLLPALGAFAKIEPIDFWLALKTNLLSEKNLVLQFPRKTLALMSLTSLLPVLVLSIRSAARPSDTSQLGVWMAAVVFHVVHALFLVVCLWVMLDPQFSPRQSGYGVPFLNLYFLSALSVGYFSGYFLLVFRPLVIRGRRPAALAGLLHSGATVGVILLAVAAPAILVIKNLPVIRTSNRDSLAEFARVTGEQLPKSGYLLADTPWRSLLTRAWLARAGRDRDFVGLEGASLALGTPAYHRYLRQEYGQKWPVNLQTNRVAPFDLGFTVGLLNGFAKSGALYYLHPSFGPFFEHFYLEPHGMHFKLQPYPADALIPPPLPPQIVAENTAFWDRLARDSFPALLSAINPPSSAAQPTLRDQLLTRLHVPAETDGTARGIGSVYSRALNFWAVEMQKTGELEQAAGLFALALKLNPGNIVAQVNLEYNKKFRAGERPPVAMPSSVEDRFGDAGSWEQVLGQHGPYDEQDFCYAQGFTFVRNGLFRQAAQAFERVHTFAPDDLPTRLYLAELNLIARKPDRALELVRAPLEQPERFHLSPTNRVDALGVQAKAWFLQGEAARADTLLETAIQAAPTNHYLLANAVAIYTENSRFSNALVNVDRQLQVRPDDPVALLNKGYLHMQLNAFGEAILAMTQLLNLQTNRPEALLNRAIAYLRNDQMDAAQKDYETLLSLDPNLRQVNYGLGEIAFRRHDTNTAIQRYESYLSNSVPGAAETLFVEKRLQELRGAKTTKP